MSLIWCDSFDHTTTILQKYDAVAGSPTIAATGARTTNALNIVNGTAGVRKNLTAAIGPTVVCGFAFSSTSHGAPSPTYTGIWTAFDGSTAQYGIGMDPNGQLSVYRGHPQGAIGNKLGDSGSKWLREDGTLYFIELKVLLSNTVGTWELRVNGEVWTSGTGVDTVAATNLTISMIQFGNQNGGGTSLAHRFDDFYLFDGSGSVNNDFAGDIGVRGLIANAAGTTTQWTPLSSTNISNVDDTPAADEDTTYNSSATVAQKDTFNMTNLSVTTGTVKGVITMRRSRKDDAGTRQLKTKIRHSATEANGATSSNESSSYLSYFDVFEQNPSTVAAWTPTEVNAMEVGYEVVA